MAPGDRVALLAPNCSDFAIAYFAVTGSGAILQPIDERLKPAEMQFILQDSGATIAIVHESQLEKFEADIQKPSGLRHVIRMGASNASWMADLATGDRNWSLPPPSCDSIAELMYTSGTTGRPKGVMRSHANVVASSDFARHAFRYRASDVITIVMPLSHSSALVSQLLPMLDAGGTCVLVERFDSNRVIDMMRQYGATCLRLVPALFQALLANREFNSSGLPSLRLLMNSSAATDVTTCGRIRERFPGARITNSYGLTEASTCTILPDDAMDEYPDSIGLPIDGVEMQVVDELGQPQADGVEGEIWVKGANVFAGYYKLPAESRAAVTEDGWLKTGDVGLRQRDGLYFYRGRRDDMINCGGLKYAPVEVERCIAEIPSVSEVSVVASPHRVLGQVAKAFVVFHPDAPADTRQVVRHCASRLPSHKVPFQVESVASLPRNSVGKILNRELRFSSGSAVAGQGDIS